MAWFLNGIINLSSAVVDFGVNAAYNGASAVLTPIGNLLGVSDIFYADEDDGIFEDEISEEEEEDEISEEEEEEEKPTLEDLLRDILYDAYNYSAEPVEQIEFILNGTLEINNSGDYDMGKMLDFDPIRRKLEELANEGRYVVTFIDFDGNEIKYTFSDIFIQNFIESIAGNLEDNDVYDYGRLVKIYNTRKIKKIVVEIWTKKNEDNNSLTGSYFNYLYKGDNDLSIFQIYTEEQLLGLENIEHCLKHSLILSLQNMVEDGIIDQDRYDISILHMTDLMFSCSFNKNKLSLIAKRLNMFISVSNIRSISGERSHYKKYGNCQRFRVDAGQPKIKLILWRDHYMPNLTIMYNNKPTLLCKIIKHLIENDLLERSTLTSIRNPSNYDSNDVDINSLYNNDIIDVDQEMFEMKPKQIKNKQIFYADFESDINDEEKHIPIMLGVVEQGSDDYVDIFYGENAFDKMMIKMVKNLNNRCKFLSKEEQKEFRSGYLGQIYFHNLKYDCKMIFQFSKGVYYKNILFRDGVFYKVDFRYGKYNFCLMDSYKIITNRLASFQKMFSLPMGKMEEFNLYSLYNEEILKRPSLFIKDLNDEYKEELDRMKYTGKFDKYFHNYENPDMSLFYHKDLYIDYLELDCLTLKYGLEAFNEFTFEVYDELGIDDPKLRLPIYEFTTASSYSNYLTSVFGCFDGVASIKGNLRDFCMQNVIGGKTMLKDNEKVIIEDEIIQDFDSCSNYPSAMNRIDGYVKGFCKVLFENSTYEEIQDFTHYIVEVNLKLTSKIYKSIPIISKLEKGKRVWCSPEDYHEDNEFINITIDKIGLQEIYKYYNVIEMEIVCGVYWNEGCNDKIVEFVQILYDIRMKAKGDKNLGLSAVLKLILNSGYGKTCQKPSTETYIIKNEDNIDDYVSRHWQNIISYQPMNNFKSQYIVRIKCNQYEHFNMCHIGGLILNMSKVIMNEVANVFDINKFPIYYCDTDSYTVRDGDLTEVAKQFKKIYGRELIGNQLGQFHSDFANIHDYDSCTIEDHYIFNEDENKNKHIDENCHSIKFIGLGKKQYLDILRNDFGDEGLHMRFKGVNHKAIHNLSNEIDLSIEEIYENIYHGEEYEVKFHSFKHTGGVFGVVKSGMMTKKIKLSS